MVAYNYTVAPFIVEDGTSPQFSLHTSNSNEELTVQYVSKNANETMIDWYKNGRPIHRNIPQYDSTDPINSWTQILFHPIRRSDAGAYRVVINNTNNFILPSMKFVDVTFVVNVSIFPVPPMQLNFDPVSRNLTWTYQNLTSDDVAQEQTLIVNFSNTMLALQLQLAAESRHANLAALIPGESYTAQVIARNQDGQGSSQHKPFTTLPEGMYAMQKLKSHEMP